MEKNLFKTSVKRGRGRPKNSASARDGSFPKEIRDLLNDEETAYQHLNKRQIRKLDKVIHSRVESLRSSLSSVELAIRAEVTKSPFLNYEQWEEVKMPSLNAPVYVDTLTHIDPEFDPAEKFAWLASEDTASAARFASAIRVNRTMIRRNKKTGLVYFLVNKRNRQKAIANGAIAINRAMFRSKIESVAQQRRENAKSDKPVVEEVLSGAEICPYCLQKYRDHHTHKTVADAMILCDFTVVSTGV